MLILGFEFGFGRLKVLRPSSTNSVQHPICIASLPYIPSGCGSVPAVSDGPNLSVMGALVPCFACTVSTVLLPEPLASRAGLHPRLLLEGLGFLCLFRMRRRALGLGIGFPPTGDPQRRVLFPRFVVAPKN